MSYVVVEPALVDVSASWVHEVSESECEYCEKIEGSQSVHPCERCGVVLPLNSLWLWDRRVLCFGCMIHRGQAVEKVDYRPSRGLKKSG